MAYDKVIRVGWCPECGRMQQVHINVAATGMQEVTVSCICGKTKPETTKVDADETYELDVAPLIDPKTGEEAQG